MSNPTLPPGQGVPGFEFLQTLARQAGSVLPGMGQWAPTLDPQELDKRIQDLRTVQFWLEQNARLLSTTIQALEVQRMTLSTLQGMNLPMADLGAALMLKPAEPAPTAAPAPAAAAPVADWASGPFGQALAASAARRARGNEAPADPQAAPAPAPASHADPRAVPAAQPPAAASRSAAAARQGSRPATAPGQAASPAVDPMQWWGSLTQQFAQLASQALEQPATAGNAPAQAWQQASQTAQDLMQQQARAARDAVGQFTQAVSAPARQPATAAQPDTGPARRRSAKAAPAAARKAPATRTGRAAPKRPRGSR